MRALGRSRCCPRGLVVLCLLTGSPGKGTRAHLGFTEGELADRSDHMFGWHLLRVVAQATEIKIPAEVRAPGEG